MIDASALIARLRALGIGLDPDGRRPRFIDVEGQGPGFGGGRVFIARHGETRANQRGLFQGGDEDLDINDLSDRGRDEARELGRRLRSRLGLRTVIASSPRRRARATARLVREQLQTMPPSGASRPDHPPIRVYEGLNEMRAGRWFNCDHRARIAAGDRTLARVAAGDFLARNGGESGAHVLARVDRVLRELGDAQREWEREAEAPVDIVIVCHTVVCQMARMLTRDADALAWTQTTLAPGTYMELAVRRDPGEPRRLEFGPTPT